MAGDWIAMRHDLWECPQVVRILSAMCPQDVRNVSARISIMGALYRTWCLIDRFAVDGILHGYTPELIDAEVAVPGWCGFLSDVGWLDVQPQFIAVPEFESHFGRSAKRRLSESKRKRESRKSCPQSVRTTADALRTTEQKRTEENSTEQKKEKASRAVARFVPPSVDDVRQYASEAGLTIDAKTFVDFYSSKGWLVGRSAMKDWRAAARNADRGGWCTGSGGSKKNSIDHLLKFED